MLICLVLTYAGMIFTDLLHRLLKTTGSNVIARLASVILAALASQFIFDGIRDARILSANCSRKNKMDDYRDIAAARASWANAKRTFVE